MKKCVVSALYGKDEFKNLHFYCDYCGKEMGYDEERDCLVERERCPNCNTDIGDSEQSLDTCFKCEKPLAV